MMSQTAPSWIESEAHDASGFADGSQCAPPSLTAAAMISFSQFW